MEQNQNTLAPESDGDSASGSLAVPAAPPAPPALAEYDSATGTFITPGLAPGRAPRPAPLPAERPAFDPPSFDPISFRARLDGWTPDRQRAFIEELADCGIVREAAARVGMSPHSAWALRRRAEGTAFGFAFEAALQAGARRLESVAFERAVEGVARPVFYQGQKVGEQRVYDNRLLLSLIARQSGGAAAAVAPDVRERWDAWLEAVGQGRRRPAPSPAEAGKPGSPVWQDEDGAWLTDFPPPAGFAGARQGEYGEDEYWRTLTADE